MTDTEQLLLALQYGDGQFPGGGFAFSWGLEGLAAYGLVARGDLAAFVAGQLRHRWAGQDRGLAAHAHARAGALASLCELDDLADALILAAPARDGSARAGRALLGVHVRLGTRFAGIYHAAVHDGRGVGHLAVVQGVVLAGAGLSLTAALTVIAYGSAAAFCTAAVRLGLASHLDGQRALGAIRLEIGSLVGAPLPALDELHIFAPLAEIAMMRHAGRSARLFST